MTKYNTYEFAQLIGVSDRTLRRWDNQGKFCAYRTPTGRPYYTNKHYKQFTQPGLKANKDNSPRNEIGRLEKRTNRTTC